MWSVDNNEKVRGELQVDEQLFKPHVYASSSLPLQERTSQTYVV